MATSPVLQEQCVSLHQFNGAVEAIKALHVLIVSLMSDIAALRQTTLDDSELQAEYRRRVRSASRQARPLLEEAMDCYDQLMEPEIIQRLQN